MSILAAVPRRPTGSVSTTADGRFRVRVTIDGKQRDLGTFDDEGFALEVLAAHNAETHVAQRTYLTLGAWGTEWLRRRARDGWHRAVSHDESRWLSRVCPPTSPWSSLPIRSLTTREVRRWVDGMVAEQLARSTVANALNLLRCCLEDAVRAGHLEENPARPIRLPRFAQRAETWTVLEVDELHAVTTDERIPEGQRLYYAVACYTGLRIGELHHLTWSQVHLGGDRPRLVVVAGRSGPTKTGKPREVPLLPQAIAAFKRLRKLRPSLPTAYVFPSPTGGARRPWDDYGWRTAKRTVGIERRVRPYDWRHTCASHLVRGTWGREWSLEEVHRWLGHESIDTTQRYTHHRVGSIVDTAARLGKTKR